MQHVGPETEFNVYAAELLAINMAVNNIIGPGSIHVAHTAEERIPKMQLQDAIGIYTRMVQQLLAGAS